MLNVGLIVGDPALAQAFTVERYVGGYVPGGEGEYVASVASTFQMTGSIQPASQANLVKYGVEGIRASDAVKVYTAEPLVYSDGDGNLSDVITWRGDRYRIAYHRQWQDFGYSFAIAGRCRDE